MKKLVPFISLLICLLTSVVVSAQKADEQANKIFEKFDYQTPNNKSYHKEIAKLNDPNDYSGIYTAIDSACFLELTVKQNGIIEGFSFEPGKEGGKPLAKAILKDAKIKGSLFTATKVYNDGTEEKVQGVFMNCSKDNKTNFGIGLIDLHVKYKIEGVGTSSYKELFFEKKS